MAIMSRERFLMACGGVLPKTGISIGVSKKNDAFRTSGTGRKKIKPEIS
jgi:hypothetical protein